MENTDILGKRKIRSHLLYACQKGNYTMKSTIHLHAYFLKYSPLILLFFVTTEISCSEKSSDDDASDDTSFTSATDGSQSTYSPNYPGISFGCEIPDTEEPANAQCFTWVYPLPEEPDTFVPSCEEGEILHNHFCPASLNTDVGSVIATCQDEANPTANTGFAPYFVYVVYENELLQFARDTASATETAQEACETLKEEFAGTFCPIDAVIVDYGYSSIDCSQL